MILLKQRDGLYRTVRCRKYTLNGSRENEQLAETLIMNGKNRLLKLTRANIYPDYRD